MLILHNFTWQNIPLIISWTYRLCIYYINVFQLLKLQKFHLMHVRTWPFLSPFHHHPPKTTHLSCSKISIIVEFSSLSTWSFSWIGLLAQLLEVQRSHDTSIWDALWFNMEVKTNPWFFFPMIYQTMGV